MKGYSFTSNPRGKKQAPKEILEILGQFAGYASVCWSKDGVFESELASLAVDNAGILIHAYYESKINE